MSKVIPTIFLSLTIASFMGLTSAQARVYDFTTGNKLTLLQDARTSVELKLEMVKRARHHIHIMTYYWDSKGFPMELITELKKANDRGVDVRIITTLIPSLSMDMTDKVKRILYSNKESSSTAILSLLRMTPGNNEALTNNIHEKIFLVDGEVAILGGRNISNNDFRAKDMEVKLEGPVVNQVQEHFQKMYSFLIGLKIKDDCEARSSECSLKYTKLKFSSEDKSFFPDQPKFAEEVKARILTNEVLIDQNANDYYGQERFFIKDDIIDTVIKQPFTLLRAYNYFILPTLRYRIYLEDNLKNHKEIRMISNSMKSASFISNKGYLVGLPETRNLITVGVKLRQWTGSAKSPTGEDQLEYLHEKVMIFDEDHAIIGSHNFGIGSTSVSSEIAVEFYSKEITKTLINVFDEEFANPEITKTETVEMVDQEMKDKKFQLKFFSLRPISTLIKELF
jgi:putative cardiolipin synthase